MEHMEERGSKPHPRRLYEIKHKFEALVKPFLVVIGQANLIFRDRPLPLIIITYNSDSRCHYLSQNNKVEDLYYQSSFMSNPHLLFERI